MLSNTCIVTCRAPLLLSVRRPRAVRQTPRWPFCSLKPFSTCQRTPPLRRQGRHEAFVGPDVPGSQDEASSAQSIWNTSINNILKVASVGAVAAVLLFMSVSPAEAARSGGRMGGSSFSSRTSSSHSGTSRDYSGYSGGMAAPQVGVSVGVGLPSFMMSPFGFGYGYPMIGGFNLMSLVFWGTFVVIMLQVVQGVVGTRRNTGYDGDGVSYDGKVTVAKVQVGLLGSARQIQSDLERIASKADTESPEGLHYILQETVLALMRNPDFCLYGCSSGAAMANAERAETRFNEYSVEERSKFEKETLVNVGGRSRRTSLKINSSGPQELIVVTILVAAEGAFKLPKITSRAELRAALSRLGSLRREDILAVEVLWTPEEEDDYFTQEDLACDYPLLNTL